MLALVVIWLIQVPKSLRAGLAALEGHWDILVVAATAHAAKANLQHPKCAAEHLRLCDCPYVAAPQLMLYCRILNMSNASLSPGILFQGVQQSALQCRKTATQ